MRVPRGNHEDGCHENARRKGRVRCTGSPSASRWRDIPRRCRYFQRSAGTCVLALLLLLQGGLLATTAEAQGSPRVCNLTPTLDPTGKINLELVESDSRGIAIDFGGERGIESDKVTLEALPEEGVRLPDVLEATVVELRRGNDASIESFDASAKREGTRYTLEVCVNPESNTKAGTYTGNVLFSSEQISSAPVPITVRLQYKYTYALQFVTVLTGLLGTVWAAATIELSAGKRGAGTRIRKRLLHWTVITALVPAVAAAWLVWSAASQDEAFGRGSGAIIAHLAAQVGPAVAAAVTAFGVKAAAAK